MKNPLLTIIFLLTTLFCVAQTITVTSVQQRSDGSGFLDVYFNLSGPASATNITMKASFDGGSTYSPIPSSFLSGAVTGVTPGSNRHIVWNGLESFPNTYSVQSELKIIAIPN